jgi:hypothetical protein
MDYDFTVKGSAAPADRFSPRHQVISTPILCLVQLLLACIFASKCVSVLWMNHFFCFPVCCWVFNEWKVASYLNFPRPYYLLPHFRTVSSFINSIF